MMPLEQPVRLEEHVWNKNGDHPLDYTKDEENHFPNPGAPSTYTAAFRRENNWEGDVVRYFRNPEVPGIDTCKCGHTFHEHGWIDQGADGITVCPGSTVIGPDEDGYYAVRKP